jgi:DNA-directed RNA polymerase subunit omega
MARVTVEDCLARVPNRFALTILASRRARALSEGRGRAMVDCDNKEGVTALREVGKAKVRFKEDVESVLVGFIEEQRRQLRVTTGEHTFLEAASLRALEDEDVELDDEVVEEDIEELQSDPEALNKQASRGVEGEEEEEAETEDEEPETDDAATDDAFEGAEDDADFVEADTPDEEEPAEEDAELE